MLSQWGISMAYYCHNDKRTWQRLNIINHVSFNGPKLANQVLVFSIGGTVISITIFAHGASSKFGNHIGLVFLDRSSLMNRCRDPSS